MPIIDIGLSGKSGELLLCCFNDFDAVIPSPPKTTVVDDLICMKKIQNLMSQNSQKRVEIIEQNVSNKYVVLFEIANFIVISRTTEGAIIFQIFLFHGASYAFN